MSKDTVDHISVQICNWMLENNGTIRKAAAHFGLSKTTVDNKIRKVQFIDEDLYKRIREHLENNFKAKNIRGGESTRMKSIKSMYELIE